MENSDEKPKRKKQLVANRSRQKKITVWVTEEERTLLKSRADEAQLPMGYYLLQVGLGGVVPPLEKGFSTSERMKLLRFGEVLNTVKASLIKSEFWDNRLEEYHELVIRELEKVIY